MTRRVVITGVGAVTPLGVGATTLHERWAAGECGIEDGEARCDDFEPDRRSCRARRRAAPTASPSSAIAAGDEAIAQARLGRRPAVRARAGRLRDRHRHRRPRHARGRSTTCCVDRGRRERVAAGGAADDGQRRRRRRWRCATACTARCYGVVSACAAGAHAIGAALRMIATGDADAVVAGGAEAALTPLATAAFARDGRDLADRHLAPVRRPPRRLRDGRGRRRARARGAARRPRRAAPTILGEVLGYGATADAYHLTAPEPDGRGARAARSSAALARRRHSSPSDVDYVNAHGTSTPLNDRAETDALKAALGDARRRGPGLLDEVGDRPPARRRRRGRGDRDGAGAARRASRRRRSATRSPTRASTSTTSPARRGRCQLNGQQRARRALELVRLRRPQRRALPRRLTVTATARATSRAPRLGPLERLERLCDPGSLQRHPHRGHARRGWAARRARATASSARAGRVDGRPVFCYAQDASFAGGSLGARTPTRSCACSQLAGRAARPGRRLRRVRRRAPAGGRRGARRLRPDLPRATWRCPGACPQISVITGTSAGGGSYSPALTDFVVMTERARRCSSPAPASCAR